MNQNPVKDSNPKKLPIINLMYRIHQEQLDLHDSDILNTSVHTYH